RLRLAVVNRYQQLLGHYFVTGLDQEPGNMPTRLHRHGTLLHRLNHPVEFKDGRH
ncbi:MAG: hypothetical protein ACJA2P_000500, partial [Rhodoferax sp.]